MGEIIKIAGVETKLGTCEDLYYIRFADLKRLRNSGQLRKMDGNLSGAEYLDENNGFRYRFPFPEEDDIHAGQYSEYNKAQIFGVKKSLLADVKHSNIVYHVSAGAMGRANMGSGYGVNLEHKCPAAPDFVRSCSAAPDRLPIAIMQQKQVEGQLWVVCACAYCGAKFRLDKPGAVELCQEIMRGLTCYDKTDNYRTYWTEIVRRILAGYIKGAL